MKYTMSDIDGFPLLFRQCKCIDMGSMPSEASLLRQEYYGHPRNAFLPIMSALFGSAPELSYQCIRRDADEKMDSCLGCVESCSPLGSSDSNNKAGVDQDK